VKDAAPWVLLQKIKDAGYVADDVIDEFEYKHMNAEAEKQRSKMSHFASSSNLLSVYFIVMSFVQG
jgi:hypothetical protein